MNLHLRNMKFNLVNQFKLNSMKSDSLKNNQRAESGSATPKKVWLKTRINIGCRYHS